MSTNSQFVIIVIIGFFIALALKILEILEVIPSLTDLISLYAGYVFVILFTVSEKILETMGFFPEEATIFPFLLVWIWIGASMLLSMICVSRAIKFIF